MRRNRTACHAHLFTVFARLNTEWEFNGKRVYAKFLLYLVMFTKIVSDMIVFRNPYLVKSVNLAFKHVLFRSVYHDIAPNNIKVSRPELLALFFNVVRD